MTTEVYSVTEATRESAGSSAGSNPVGATRRQAAAGDIPFRPRTAARSTSASTSRPTSTSSSARHRLTRRAENCGAALDEIFRAKPSSSKGSLPEEGCRLDQRRARYPGGPGAAAISRRHSNANRLGPHAQGGWGPFASVPRAHLAAVVRRTADGRSRSATRRLVRMAMGAIRQHWARGSPRAGANQLTREL